MNPLADIEKVPDGGAHLGLECWRAPDGPERIFYTDVKGYRVAVGAPRGAADRLRNFFSLFEASCREADRRPVYFGLSKAALEGLDPEGLRGRWHAGDVPLFSLERWLDTETSCEDVYPAIPLKASAGVPAGIRAQARRARNQGVTVRRLAAAPGPDDATGPALRKCLRSWLADKALPPLGFATSPFLLDPWPGQGVFVAERAGRIEAYLVPSLALFPDLWRVDAIGRAPTAPNGCAELLVYEAFQYAAESCYQTATLGLAPLARRSGEGSSHWMDPVAEFVREARVPGYSFAGLEAFKAKFEPDEWRPVFCVSGGGRLSLRDMLAVARAFAGGSLVGYMVRSASWVLGRRSLSMSK